MISRVVKTCSSTFSQKDWPFQLKVAIVVAVWIRDEIIAIVEKEFG